MSNFAGFNRNADPARNKASALQGFPAMNYANQVQQFNTSLYQPMDTKPTPGYPANPAAPAWNRTGWNLPTPRPMTGAPATKTGNMLGARMSSFDQNNAGAPSMQDSLPSMAPPTMAQNAMQRWANQQNTQPQNGFRQLSDPTKFFWATGRIDGRAPQANVQQGLSTGGFGPNGSSLANGNTHMPSRPVNAPEGGYSWQRTGQQQHTTPGTWNDWTPY